MVNYIKLLDIKMLYHTKLHLVLHAQKRNATNTQYNIKLLYVIEYHLV
jgi:hypothetical protein